MLFSHCSVEVLCLGRKHCIQHYIELRAADKPIIFCSHFFPEHPCYLPIIEICQMGTFFSCIATPVRLFDPFLVYNT